MGVDLDAELTRLGELTDSWIRDAVRRHLSPEGKRLAAMLEYHLGWRGPDLEVLSKAAPAGKKLRPALVLLTSQAVGGEITQAARNSAVAVELIHNFSLVHDDIQDHSELRRHRPTVWTLWGMPQGINAGDALFALAQVVLAEEGTAIAAQLTAELNRTALALAEGQFLDIDLANGQTQPTLEAYEAMISRKTGVLFACACRLGAMSAGAPEGQADAYAAYGLQLGIAFQEQDDLLGVWGLSAETGKPDAADILERKRGLPAAMALGRTDAPEWLRAAYHADDVDVPPATVERIIAHFDALNLREIIERRVEDRYRQALDHLEEAGPREPAQGYLAAICEALVSRRT
ncbi:MAG: polyprenyl synthetase family protein [Chloroflexi bacterium]|nr:polyprenyl synthetase family protein [Chloroflexota bacterium]MBV9895339.1 polyprenyl synthetase family protein [Chloroflexota bacterium]